MALLNLDHDPWSSEHAACERFHQTISEQLHARSLEMRESESYARISASIRLRLKQFGTEVDELKQKLQLTSKTLTSQEYERRVRLIENLKSKHIQLVQRFNDRTKVTSGFSQDRSSLLSSKIVADGGTTGWGIDDDDDDRPDRPLLAQSSSSWTVDDLRAHQKRIVDVQDEGLENLSKVISRQKEIVVSINSEVDLHNEVIDDIAVKMDRATASSQQETQQIGVILQKDSTWGYWLVILILFCAIVTVAMIPT